MRTNLNAFLLILLLPYVSIANKPSTKTKDKPNIIFIFADDQAYNTINALGNKEIITPNLDELVKQGVTFTHNYNMGAWNGAVCVASRTMLNTGKTVWRAKEMSPGLWGGKHSDKLWGNLMKSGGYDTYMTGKWHIGGKPDSSFINVGTVRKGMPNQTKTRYKRDFSLADTLWKPWKTEFDGYWKDGKHWSEVTANEAIGFIDDAKTKENPFFMYVAFNAPHDPRQSPKEYVDKYPLEKISIPKSFIPSYPNEELIGLGKTLRDEKLAPFPRTEHSVKVNRQEYYAIITHMDYQIKRILDALKQSGKADNTYIIFTADHGLACGNHGLIGKQNMYDHSVRSPLIIVGPDIPKNKKREMDIYLQDIMPTTLELASVEKPQYVEFNSLLDLIHRERKNSYYPAIYGSYKNQQRMIRKDNFKLIVYPEVPELLLYNLKKDPHEMNNLAKQEKYKPMVKELFQELIHLQHNYNDTLNLENIFTEL